MSFPTKHKTMSFNDVLKNFITLHATPHKIAMGLAVGIFFSVLPTFGWGILVSLLLAWYKKWNIIATYLGTLFIFPLSDFYFSEYQLGNWLIGQHQAGSLMITSENVKYVAFEVYLGGIIVAVISSVFIYFMVYPILAKYNKRKHVYASAKSNS